MNQLISKTLLYKKWSKPFNYQVYQNIDGYSFKPNFYEMNRKLLLYMRSNWRKENLLNATKQNLQKPFKVVCLQNNLHTSSKNWQNCSFRLVVIRWGILVVAFSLFRGRGLFLHRLKSLFAQTTLLLRLVSAWTLEIFNRDL